MCPISNTIYLTERGWWQEGGVRNERGQKVKTTRLTIILSGEVEPNDRMMTPEGSVLSSWSAKVSAQGAVIRVYVNREYLREQSEGYLNWSLARAIYLMTQPVVDYRDPGLDEMAAKLGELANPYLKLRTERWWERIVGRAEAQSCQGTVRCGWCQAVYRCVGASIMDGHVL